ncbi:MAG TPA: patatin-like phospholipase family protein [Mucilaginibacter sp.]|nr:patatin-like phospholipase family protein [Mucilaginibacter sp.]
MLNGSDQRGYDKWWKASHRKDPISRYEKARALLESDSMLIGRLNDEHIALPFETLFNSELNEIAQSRKKRLIDNPTMASTPVPQEVLAANETKDPLLRATGMDLHGLALSGGGIRSATFSLGVLQKLAEENKLSRFDYLSTVSGGGYIGTWLASWIKRGGSVAKVADRLNIRKSSDPQGEEVRPIRWLRMFSNYLAPDASIMSADSWTMGITWLRNTLINQVLLLLLLCTALSLVTDLFFIWQKITRIPDSFDPAVVAAWSALIFAPGVLIVGVGMKTYDTAHDERALFTFGRNRLLSLMLILWAIAAAYLISSWLYHDSPGHPGYLGKVSLLWPAALAGAAAMLAIAYIGLYRLCAQRPLEKKLVDGAIIGSSLVAAAAGLFLLSGVWMLFLQRQSAFPAFPLKAEKWVFIAGPPLILECISCCVVIRMALMGKLFPDERREWWGRMGAIVHRFMLLWLLITYGALVLPGEFREFRKHAPLNIPALFGGWATIIGFAVKLAYQPTESADKPGSVRSMATEVFIRIAPYLFMVGFLLIGAYTLEGLSLLIAGMLQNIPHDLADCFKVSIVIGVITYIFSWRVGVNEFSLHHFYRNRLVRAYLGATRKRTDRDKTVNNFTGFDKNDDIKLATFTSAQGEDAYTGPFPIINTTLNATVVSELDRQDRKAESFVFTPLYCGFDFSPTRSAAYAKDNVYEYGYRPTNEFAYEKGPMIGTAMAISGAAVNPNMGYHSAPATAFLLTMFNVRLGWWIGNPRRNTYKNSDPTLGVAYLLSDLIGKSDIDSRYVCLSDGGHFDNMGLYELIRRRCNHITLVDAEEDKAATCEGLANAIRRCRIDFGVEIDIKTESITKKNSKGFSKAHHITTGTITYPDGRVPVGSLTYIKATLTGDESTDIREYHLKNALFPQQPTGDQFFTEEQFESYRQLGYRSI